MANETIVRLRILSDQHEAEEIGRLIGMKCDTSWKKGDKRAQGAIIQHDKNGWLLSSGCGREVGLEDQLAALLDRVGIQADQIRKIAVENEVEVSCVLYSENAPALNFPPSVIQKLALLGASLDVDLYLG